MTSPRSRRSDRLDATSQSWLLAQARAAIACHLSGTLRDPPLADTPAPAHAVRGCFVGIRTLPGDLRGCVGTLEAEQPLWLHAQDMAVAAASRDRRFVPLAPHELDTCILEIVVLTARQPLRMDRLQTDLRLGEHGLWVQRGPFRGGLLPQVAVTYGWDQETFLAQACIKAGLEADAWLDPAVEVCTFTTEAFSEAERLL